MDTHETLFNDALNEYNKYNAHLCDSDENDTAVPQSLWSTDWTECKNQSKKDKILPPTPPPPNIGNELTDLDEFSDFCMFKFAQTATELNPKAKEWSQASPSTSATSTSNGNSKAQKLSIDNSSPNMLTEMSIASSPLSVSGVSEKRVSNNNNGMNHADQYCHVETGIFNAISALQTANE